jgi:hypothetical protein
MRGSRTESTKFDLSSVDNAKIEEPRGAIVKVMSCGRDPQRCHAFRRLDLERAKYPFTPPVLVDLCNIWARRNDPARLCRFSVGRGKGKGTHRLPSGQRQKK